MPDWTTLRARACERHASLRPLLPPDAPALPSAEQLLRAAAQAADMDLKALRPEDALLYGAYAVLDRDTECIRYSSDLNKTPARKHFILAHEFAHFWLHPSLETDSWKPEQDPDELLAPAVSSGAQTATGYSPVERREIEANLFALEFLLPAPILRTLWLKGWTVPRFVAQSGVSEASVLAQLMQALLLPAPNDSESVSTSSRIPPLTSDQHRAATVATGPVLINAGPGTGKTRTLVARACHLLQERGVAPENLLALTFSNKAAAEMRTRLQTQLGEMADRVWIGTFHAFGLEILRKDGAALGLPLMPRLLETVEAVALLERHLDELPLQHLESLAYPLQSLPAILACISRAKDELLMPDEYLACAVRQRDASQDERQQVAAEKSLEVAHVYTVYQRLLAQEGCLDFGDLLMRSVALLDTYPDIQQRWQAQFPFVLADEYQDINRASAQLLRRIAGDGIGLWAVGDLRQAIYRFRGADAENVRDFDRDFPGARILPLGWNYRSLPPLVALFNAASSAMGPDGSPLKADLTAARPESREPAITVAVAEDAPAQAQGLARQMRAWNLAGVSFQEQAVLCRTNRQAMQIAGLLETCGIPVQHVGRLFDRAEIKDLLALLSLTASPEGVPLTRIAQFPDYAIPQEDVARLMTAAHAQNRPFPSALQITASLPELTFQGKEGFAKLRRDLDPIAQHGNAWLFLCRYLFQTSRYLRPLLALPPHRAQGALLALYQLLVAIQDWTYGVQGFGAKATREEILKHIRKLLAIGEGKSLRLPTGPGRFEGVKILTAHGAKGLEFPVVYIPNMNTGSFPPRPAPHWVSPPPFWNQGEEERATRSATGQKRVGAENAEERRKTDAISEEEASLFYVALSRAQDHLLLSYCISQNGRRLAPSPLLTDLEPALTKCGALRVTWAGQAESAAAKSKEEASEAARTPEGSPPASEHDANRTTDLCVSLSAVEQYQTCPRRYYYRQVLQLPDGSEPSAYLAFYDAIQKTLQSLQSEPAADDALPLAHVQAHWNTSSSRLRSEFDSGHARLLARRAEEMLPHIRRYCSESPIGGSEEEWTATLANGKITFRCDGVVHQPDGSRQFTRTRLRRLKPDEHTQERLALWREAARQQNPEVPAHIRVVSLADGEVRSVPPAPRYEPKRVAKYDDALQGIAEGRFPAQPDDTECARCPYFFICPS